jgi:hypothetical protein
MTLLDSREGLLHGVSYCAIFSTYESNEAWRFQSALYDAVSLGKYVLTFRKIVELSSGGSSSLLGLFNPEVEDSTILRNAGESWLNDTA